MTIITGSQFRSNQGKYIGMAHKGERVVISSKSGYAELTPVADNDEEVMEHIHGKCFLTVSKIGKDVEEGDYVTLRSREDIDKWFDSL